METSFLVLFHSHYPENDWAEAWQNKQNDLCTQRRLGYAWASRDPSSPIRFFAVRMKKSWVLTTHWVRICRLSRVLPGRKPRRQVFSWRTSFNYKNKSGVMRFAILQARVCSHSVDPAMWSSSTSYAKSFRRRFFVYHQAMKDPHANIIVSLFSIPFVLKCAA